MSQTERHDLLRSLDFARGLERFYITVPEPWFCRIGGERRFEKLQRCRRLVELDGDDTHIVVCVRMLWCYLQYRAIKFFRFFQPPRLVVQDRVIECFFYECGIVGWIAHYWRADLAGDV